MKIFLTLILLACCFSGQTADPLTLTGIVRFWATDQGIPDVTVTVTGDATNSVLTDACGRYVLSVPGPGSYQISCLKTNDDPLTNGVTVADTDAMRSNILATVPFTSPFQWVAGDVNGTRTISAADVTLTTRFINGTSNTFPVGLWQFVPFNWTFPATNYPWGWTNLVLPSVTGSLTGLDFWATKTGDVNGSWHGL
jgi:hypothetical protein